METVEADYIQIAVGDAIIEEEEVAVAMAISNATEVGREDGGAVAVGDALFDQSAEEEGATVMPIGDPVEVLISGATVTQMNGASEMPFDGATMMPSSGATPILTDGATAMPVDGDMELPTNSAIATPTIDTTAMPADVATTMPIDGDLELSTNSATATPTTGAMAMPTEGATAMMFSIAMDCEPVATNVDLCKACGQRHLLDENHEYNYKDEVDDELMCHICLQPLISPLDTPCGHTYCQECLTNFLVESDFCPVDRVPILLQNCRKSNVLVHKLLDKLIVSCPFKEHCSETMSRADLQGHLLNRWVLRNKSEYLYFEVTKKTSPLHYHV